ncbi:hypothetical protein MKW92_015410, partial [Papaver armeniacum]
MFVEITESIACYLRSGRDDFFLQLRQGKMLIAMLPIDIVCLEIKLFFNHTHHTRMSSCRCFKYAAIVFDCGKGFQLVKGLFSFIFESKDYLDAITSCVIVILRYCFDLLFGYS